MTEHDKTKTGARDRPARAPDVWILGDIHGDFRKLIQFVKDLRPQAVISVGDMEPSAPLQEVLREILDSTEFWFVHGNHDTDTDGLANHIWGSTLAARNIHGRVVDIAGWRVAGLGGIFREAVWRPPQQPNYRSEPEFLEAMKQRRRYHDSLPRQHKSTIFPDVYDRLAKGEAQVLVVHEAPSAHPHGFQAIDDLAEVLRVDRVFHGHHHDSLDYDDFNRAHSFAVHGVGLRGITRIDGHRIAPGDRDAARSGRGKGHG